MRKLFPFLALLAVAVVCWLVISRGTSNNRRATDQAPESAEVSGLVKSKPQEHESKTQENLKTTVQEISAPEAPPVQDYDHVSSVMADASPQAASVNEALKTRRNPERLSALISPKPFNLAEFNADPEKYCQIAEPGRCYQCAQPGKEIPAINAQTPRLSRIKQGESVKLTVKSAPLAPVSFTSFDLGTFAESKLNCVTVRADKDGVASVTFIATPGALNDCNILAGSPMASGQATFVVEISEAN